MKSNALFAVSLLILAGCGNSSKNQLPLPLLRFGGMKGDVAKVKESTYDAVEKFGDIYPDELNQVFVTEYTSNGRPKSYAAYDYDGDWNYKYENSYEGDRCIKTVTHQRYGNTTTEMVFVEGRKNYEKWANTTDGKTTYTEIFYEGLKQISKDEEGNTVFELEVDKEGRPIDQKNYNNGEIVYRRRCQYDAKGLLSKTTEYFSATDGRPEIHTYSYPEFDKRGNWITQHVFTDDGEATYVIKREITYR